MPQQDTREISVKTPLEEDKLLLRHMVATEQLGRPYTYELELLSKDEAIDPDALLGEMMTVRLAIGEDGERFFSGVVTRFALVGRMGNYAIYQATLRPWFWLLTRTTDCRIYKGNVFDIVRDAFKNFAFVDYDDADCDKGKSPAREFNVQYRETYFDFVSRLLEQDGIYYWFKHKDGKVTMQLADSAKCHTVGPGCDDLPYYPPSAGDVGVGESVSSWSFSREIQPGKYTLDDYDFERPSTDIGVNAAAGRKHAQAALEVYDYPGEYVDAAGPGKHYVRTRLEELQSQHARVRGSGDVKGLHVGGLFTLSGHPRDDQNKEYLVVSAVHELRSNEFESQSGAAGQTTYEVHFEAILSAEPYRAPRLTPLPVIRGPQTAIVVGPSDEEIWTDKYGRVKVQFHWDRLGTYNEESSCWIRVAQVWAGQGWGAIHVPRIGQEVIVEFLEGDPDRPIVTGRVYNAEQMPPYDLTVSPTQSGLKSRTTKGGTPSNFNELRFEDKQGAEEVFLHAEKNWKIHVKEGETETVGASISSSAGGSISRSAGADHSRTANKNITDKAGTDITTTSGKNMTLSSGGSYSLHTNLGIHLKAMNFIAAMIESGAKAAADAIKKGAMSTGVAAGVAGHQASSGAGGGGDSLKAGAGAAGSQIASGAQQAGQQALAALSPGIEAGAAELTRMSNDASKGMTKLEGPVNKAIEKADALKSAIESGAGAEAVAAAFMALADAAMDAWKDAAKIIEGLLPQIPSIVLWAMKDIQATALWSMQLTTRVKSIDIQAKNKDINIKAKKNVNLQAEDKDLNVKAKQNLNLEATDKNLSLLAKTKDLLITAKEKVTIKAEDKDLVIEAGKTRVIVKAAKQMVFKCGSASIAMKEGGDILIKGGKITLKGTDAVEVKGNPIKLN